MIHDFCGGLEEELLRTNFILVYELIDEMIVFAFPLNFTRTTASPRSPTQKFSVSSLPLKLRKPTLAQCTYKLMTNLSRDYLWSHLYLDKLKLTDSVSEKESQKSVQKDTNDVFVEIQEKINAVFNVSGFAIYIKISGMILIRNYLHHRLNLRILMNEEFNIDNENTFTNNINQGLNFGFKGQLQSQFENLNVQFSYSY